MAQIDVSWPMGSSQLADCVRRHDWTSTPLGPIEAWSERFRVMVEQMLASPFVSTLVCGPERILVYNDAAAKLYGERHPSALGQPLCKNFPEGWATVAGFYERAFAGETVRVSEQPLDTRGTGEATDVFDALLTPVHEADGRVAYVHMVGFEVGERARVEAALRTSEAQFRTLADTAPALIWRNDERGGNVFINKYFLAFTGKTPDAIRGEGWHTLVHPDEVEGYVADYLAAVRERRAWQNRNRLQRHDGAWCWFENYAQPLFGEGGIYLGHVGVSTDITSRVEAEAALCASEERQAFLLRLSDALRPLNDPRKIQAAATRLLRERFDAGWCYYAEYDAGGRVATVLADAVRDSLPSLAGRHDVSDIPEYIAFLRATKMFNTTDIASDELISPLIAERYTAMGVHAMLGVALVKEGGELPSLFMADTAPRRWPQEAVDLIGDVAERTWAAVERARAEAALRESEERFSQFAVSSSDALWIRDAATLTMEYASPAIQTIYGVPPEDILGDPKRWAAIIVPDDRDAALMNLERARAGEAVTHEFRILRASDGAFRWIKNTDFPLRDDQGRVQRIGGIAQDVTEAKQATEHQTVLLLELQHRVRNILAMVRSVASQTGDTASDVEDYRDLLEGRLRALARVQTLLTRAANVGVNLATLIRAEIEAQAAHERQCMLSGPELVLSPKAAEVLTLAIHELATNALKYGAFSHTAGRLAVSWRVIYPVKEPWLHLDWIETGASAPLPPPQREGFGTTLIQGRIPYELKGRGHLAITAEGARCQLEFPLRRGDSILETDTVTLNTTIAGGALDMTGEADLSGCKVLVIEDDFFLANDTGRAVRKAGGHVLGPVGHEDDALDMLAGEAPTCALVDINLGHGAEFRVAEALQNAGVPFVFVTGYDDVVIPARFDTIERLRKPLDYREIVRAAARLCAA